MLDFEENKRHFTTIRLINKPRYTEGSNELTIDIDKDLIPYIIDLKREFTRYQIENILRLKSSYAVRVYELLKQYENIGKREINIKDLREYLGIDKKEYTRFDNFEARVLTPAQEEINKHTDINIEYEKLKQGRKIISILFKVEPKDTQDQVYNEYLKEFYNIQDMKIKMGLSSENFNSKQVMEIYELAIQKTQDDLDPFEYIRLNYLYMIEKGAARNKYSYLLSAIEDDYAAAGGQLSLLNMI